MYSWWLPRVGRTSSDARKHRATSQRLRLFFFHCYPKIYVSLFREREKKKPGRTIFDIYDSFPSKVFKVSSHFAERKSRGLELKIDRNVKRWQNRLDDRMGREDGKGWRLKRIGRVRDRRKRNGAERQAWYEAIASGSVLHRGRDTRCTTRARNAFQRRVSESVEQVYARESIYPVHILLQVPGVQETIGIHRVELVTPK